MGLTCRLRHLRPLSPPIPSPSFARFSSSSSSSDEPKWDPQADGTSTSSQSPSSFSSYFSDVKASLRQEPPPPNRPYQSAKPFNRTATTNPAPPPSIQNLDEIRKNLSEFRRRVAAPSPSSPDGKSTSASHAQPVSMHELYKRRVLSKGENIDTDANRPPVGGKYGLNAIRDSLKNMGSSFEKNKGNGISNMNNALSFLRLNQRQMGPSETESPVIGGTSHLPFPVFGKEIFGKDNKDSMRTEFRRMYSYVELGDKLRGLRPDNKDGKSTFSLAELNERLIKLREDEEKETQSRFGAGISFGDLRESLMNITIADEEKKKSNTMFRLDVLGQIGGTPSFMSSAPKEHLIEKYFHPDNMSSEEKLKLELKKVRDEFKMSESDCGSARVQVAQLTTKIKHLSSVLHKKGRGLLISCGTTFF